MDHLQEKATSMQVADTPAKCLQVIAPYILCMQGADTPVDYLQEKATSMQVADTPAKCWQVIAP